MWQIINGRVRCFCKATFQVSYEQAKENEVVVTVCDGYQTPDEEETPLTPRSKIAENRERKMTAEKALEDIEREISGE